MSLSLNVDSEIFRAYACYAAAVLGKTLFMSTWTALNRFANKAFANPEDAKGMPGGRVDKQVEAVERVRRNHMNDIENVFPFVMIAGLYVMTANPSMASALWHFRIFVGSRFLHTACYLGAIPQPSRALAWGAGYGACISMIYQILTAH